VIAWVFGLPPFFGTMCFVPWCVSTAWIGSWWGSATALVVMVLILITPINLYFSLRCCRQEFGERVPLSDALHLVKFWWVFFSTCVAHIALTIAYPVLFYRSWVWVSQFV
jgi:hypothetical protein